MRSLPKSIAMFVAQKGIIDFNQPCKHTQSLEKDFKRYSHDPFSSLFSDNNDDGNKIEEDNESEIPSLNEQVKILHNEILSLHNKKSKSIMHDKGKIATIHTKTIGLQENHNLAINSFQNLDCHFPPLEIEYKECLTKNSLF